VYTAHSGEKALSIITEVSPDVVLLDIKLPDIEGMVLLEKIKKIDENIPVVIVSGVNEVKLAVESIKKGAFDYVTKPFNKDELLLVINRACESEVLKKEVKFLRSKLFDTAYPGIGLIGNSPAINNVIELIKKVAPTNMTVLLVGESGVGKEEIAHTVYKLSKRNDKPFITVDCGTIPEGLIESELFGYEKGAFTGADTRKPGKFELAHTGTIFLNEISNLPFSAQAKLLRVLQEREIQHLGGNKVIKVDVRIIADTNIPLEEKVKQGTFREDLYHRLNEFVIEIPPLRERGDDVFLLAEKFIEEANREFNKNVRGLSLEVKKLFLLYPWPGNIRELKSVIKRAVLLADNIIYPQHLPPAIQLVVKNGVSTVGEKSGVSKPLTRDVKEEEYTLKSSIWKTERETILSVLEKVRYNRKEAAKLLGITRRALYYKLHKLGLEHLIATRKKGHQERSSA
ncbi:MAG: sigma-54 dependent transcriptional regulator, partial [Endomicrobia bacterium]|nr:sigma-54 dependent transcriptional regulator [Endomicrobiia bacterium]